MNVSEERDINKNKSKLTQKWKINVLYYIVNEI